MTLPEKLSPGGTGTRTRSGAACCGTFAPNKIFFGLLCSSEGFLLSSPVYKSFNHDLESLMTAKCLKLWACNMAQALCEEHLVVAKTEAREQAEEPEKG